MNLSYVLWVGTLNVGAISLMLAAALLRPLSPVLLLRAINRNLLVIFLLANLITGAVNLSLCTTRVSDAVAWTIMVGYLSAVCAVACYLEVRQVTLRWR
mmetsp:Transcript_10696/g.22570  ORF Transcript_10696/g.22570 Transcript_10696/m.22570 type:complete len:99 (+) Transcript_10696:123-419(+)